MKLKQKPEDFSVKESYRFEEVPGGRFRVYLMDKQKLSTFDAVERIRSRFGLRPGAVSHCGLKDKQGRTEQLIAVEGADVDLQEPDLRLKYLGRLDKPLSAENIQSNRFSVTVRAIEDSDIAPLNLAAAEVNRLGVVNYFDNQRFGSLKHGQGYIAKDLLRGDFEAALRNYMAVPSPLDRSEDAKVKAFWRDNWGKFDRSAPFEGNRKYFRVLSALRKNPKDFVTAFLQIDSDYRAMQLFTYQSYLWNEGVRRLLQLLFPREQLFPMPYQAGTLLFHRDASPEVLDRLRNLTFPLLAPTTRFTDDLVRQAAEWALGKEKLTLDKLRIEKAPKLLFFKHEERPVLVFPHKLVLGRLSADELNRPLSKLNVAFTLPPGSYATLVVKRLFHFSYRDDTPDEIRAQQTFSAARRAEREQEDEADRTPAPRRRSERTGPSRPEEREGPVLRFSRHPSRHPRPERPRSDASAAPATRPAKGSSPSQQPSRAPAEGFLAQQKARKLAKAQARSAATAAVRRPKAGRKPSK